MAELRLSAGVSSRPLETAEAAQFLVSARGGPTALVIEGEPGIGKTTLWLETVKLAREGGFRVLSARTAAVESGLAYASLTDLLRDVDAALLDQLPQPQKVAVDQILLRTSQNSAATDQRAVGAAFLSIVERLGETSPVLIGIDDLQWLDRSSRLALAFVTRRLAAGVGVLCTRRAPVRKTR